MSEKYLKTQRICLFLFQYGTEYEKDFFIVVNVIIMIDDNGDYILKGNSFKNSSLSICSHEYIL